MSDFGGPRPRAHQPSPNASSGFLVRTGSLARPRVELADTGVYWTIGVYLASRVLLLAVAIAAARIRHLSLLSELGRWDGTWYAAIASHGYPNHLVPGPSELGFFPLLPLVTWLVLEMLGWRARRFDRQVPRH